MTTSRLTKTALATTSRGIPGFLSRRNNKRGLVWGRECFRRNNSSDRYQLTMAKLESPSAQRNKVPIWEQVFEQRLLQGNDNIAAKIKVLEVAGGCGVHTQFFAQQLAERHVAALWQSTDPDASAVASQEAYINEIASADNAVHDGETEGGWKTYGTVQFAKPRFLTLNTNGIQESDTDAVLADESFDWTWNINMIHISPWSATQGLMKMAGRKLKPNTGRLFLYGPYRVQGSMVESNQ